MGADTFVNIEKGSDPQEAFRAAADQARYEHGAGGYSGTLAEKHDYVVVRHDPLPLSQAQALARQMIDDDDPRISDKWGPAGMIPLLNVDSEGLPVRTVTVTLTTPDYNDAWREAKQAAAKKARNGECVRGVCETHGGTSDGTARTKTSVQATSGSIVKGYVLVVDGKELDTVYDRLADARAAADKKARGWEPSHWSRWQTRTDIAVRGILARRQVDGTLTRDLMRATTETISVKRTFEATLETAPTGGATVGWLIFGWASC